MIADEAIVISRPKEYPRPLFDFIEADLDRPDFKVKTIITENGPMAGIEWMLPTVVIAYLLKPFFEAALQEAGKDFYEFAKSKMKRFIAKNRKVKGQYITAKGSTEKLSGKYDQSHTISVKAILHSKLRITVLFSESVPDDEFDEMLEGLFQIINLLYQECQKQEPEKAVKLPIENEVFLIGNVLSKRWETLTRQQMMERYKSD